MQLIQRNPRDETAWFLLASVLEKPHLKQKCLLQVLELNPKNSQAKKELRKLVGSPAPKPVTRPINAATAPIRPQPLQKPTGTARQPFIHAARLEEPSGRVVQSKRMDWKLLAAGVLLLPLMGAGLLLILLALADYLFPIRPLLKSTFKGGYNSRLPALGKGLALFIAMILGVILLVTPAMQPATTGGWEELPVIARVNTQKISPSITLTPTSTQTLQPSETPFLPEQPTEIPTATAVPTETPVPSPTEEPRPSPEDWQNWPVIPEVSKHARKIYRKGIANGTNPNAFSIVGDCQSIPWRFLGVFDNGNYTLSEDQQSLQETIDNFSGSFSRYGMTIIDGGNAAVELSPYWANLSYCDRGETPLSCELRLHNPSIVFFMLGTHRTGRNDQYVRQILETIIESGALPILATKADNLEGDESINLDITQAASNYDIPLWNFWAAVQDLDNGGLDPWQQGGNMYLVDEGLQRHRLTALQALDKVWKSVR